MPLLRASVIRELKIAAKDGRLESALSSLNADDVMQEQPAWLVRCEPLVSSFLNSCKGEVLTPKREGDVAVGLYDKLVGAQGKPISPRTASESLLWVSLGATSCLEYVRARWPEVRRERVLDVNPSKHAIARLWYGAYLLRVEDNYHWVRKLFPLSDLVQFLGYRFMRVRALATATVDALEGASSEAQQAVARSLDRYGGDHLLDASELSGFGWSPEAHARYLSVIYRLHPELRR